MISKKEETVVSICAAMRMLVPCDLCMNYKSRVHIANPERLRSQREISMSLVTASDVAELLFNF
jgi:hypothetical protein